MIYVCVCDRIINMDRQQASKFLHPIVIWVLNIIIMGHLESTLLDFVMFKISSLVPSVCSRLQGDKNKSKRHIQLFEKINWLTSSENRGNFGMK